MSSDGTQDGRDVHELVALLAVDALTGREREEADAMILGRPDLQAELDEMRAVLGALAEAERRTPPAGLRQSILAEVARTPQEAAPPPAVAAPAAPSVVDIGSRRRRVFAVVAAAAAVVAIGVGLLVAAPWSESGPGDEVAAVVDSADAVTIEMPGELPGVTIVHSADQDASVLLADAVPVPAGDRVYELWAIRDGTPERYAIFRPDDDGQLSIYAAGLDPASADQWAITEEPAGGTDTPTPPILNITA